MSRKAVSAIEGVNIFTKAWNEIKKINWHEVNRLSHQNFYIGLVGNDADIAAMKEWLLRFPYALGNVEMERRAIFHERHMFKHTTEIHMGFDSEYDERRIKAATFCLVAPAFLDEVRKYKVDAYVFYPDDMFELPAQILSNYYDLRFGLSYSFPVFRPKHASREIENTAFQNASWVIVSGLSNIIPGPHQIISAPLEGISDFTVLTANEIKLLFELIGLSGHRVRPLYRLGEFGFVLMMAKLAETIANNLAARVPAASGLVIKGAVAYAFTWAIGEAIYYYQASGRKASTGFLAGKFRERYAEGKQVAESIIKNKMVEKTLH
jgi:hypothetical protein